jgi:phosphatidylglycerol lysyltransferase
MFTIRRGPTPTNGTSLLDLQTQADQATVGTEVGVGGERESSVLTPSRAVRSGSDRRRVRHFFGGLLALVGCLDVIEALIAHHPLRSQVLDALLPPDVRWGGRTGVVVAGLALMLLARGIARGKKVAWQLTVAALLASILFHLLKDLDFEEACLAGWILLGLVWMRHHFQAESDPASVRRGVVVLGFSVLLAAAYAAAGNLLLSGHLAHSSRIAWFLASLPFVAASMVLAGLVELLRPVLAPAPSAAERDRLREVTARWGHNPVAHLALHGPKSYFWADARSCVAFTLVGRTALALGDPIAPPDRVGRTAAAFVAFCDRQDWTPAFYQIEGWSPYVDLGLRLVPIGADAVIPTRSFSLQGKDHAALRGALRRCEREGIRFVFGPAPEAWEEASVELLEVSGHWLGSGKGPELGFSLGGLDTLRDPAITVGRAYDRAGRLLAFVSWLPVPARQGWTLDLMRRRPDAPRGVMEALIVKSIEEASRRRLQEVSLGLAPLMTTSGSDEVADRALKEVYSRLDHFRRSHSLRRFKAKFAPVWEERYLVVPTAAVLPEVLIALLRAHLPRLSLLSLKLRALPAASIRAMRREFGWRRMRRQI